MLGNQRFAWRLLLSAWPPGASSLELRKLLNRFIAVCDAIAYAHSRGVLHRDIKPANVMLGDYGETLVVDWGLAKAVGSEQWAVGTEEHDETALRPAHRDRTARITPMHERPMTEPPVP
jgi:serine/threonine protein kinase